MQNFAPFIIVLIMYKYRSFRSYNAVYEVWSWLVDSLCLQTSTDKQRMVEMYHSSTEKSTKERIFVDFRSKNSAIKVLVCTVAFGMGIEIPDVEIVIHWGSPSSVLAYWQEVGRAGRTGQPSLAIMYPFPRSMIPRLTDTDMKSVIKTNACIRKQVLRHFALRGTDTSSIDGKTPDCASAGCNNCMCPKCLCCSICHASCLCSGKVSNIERFCRI